MSSTDRETLNEGRRLSPATSTPPGRTERQTESASFAQRRPEVIPGYEAPSPASRRGGSSALNEGRRLSPATSRPAARLRGPTAARSTKAGGYPRLRGGRCRRRTGRRSSALNEGRRLSPATSTGLRDDHRPPVRRSTKAGGYPRLRGARYPYSSAGRIPLNEGRRLSPATSVAAAGGGGERAGRSTKAGGYPRLRAGGERRAEHRVVVGRSTKAGGYPRLRAEGGWPWETDEERSTKAGGYPRLRGRPQNWRAPPEAIAQRRPEVIPGYEVNDYAHFASAYRSTKAGGYPRLRARVILAGYGRPICLAQRRPEVIPGYEPPHPVS